MLQKQLEELHRQASSHYLKGDFAAAMDAWRKVLEIDPDDERGRDGIRLCEQLDECIGNDPTPPPVQADPAPAPPTASASPDEATIDQAAAKELRRRVENLLDEAQSLVDQGDDEGALRTIERVLILDEENERAWALKERLEPAGAEADDDGELLIEEPVLEALEPQEEFKVLGSHEGVEPFASPTEDQAAGAAPLEMLSEETGQDEDQSWESSTDAEPPPAPAPQAAKAASRAWYRNPRVVLGAGGALAIAAVFVGLRLFQGGGAPELQPPPTGTDDLPAVVDTQAGEGQPAPARPAAAWDPEPLMRDARAAVEREDFAAALVAYDEVLKQLPDHAEARVQMKVAVERYREQQELQQQWDEAATAFEQGNYTEALRWFYRMPKDAYDADIERYKVNGWYNLGVAALQAKDCSRAVEKFEEARTISPTDPGVLGGLDLAEQCRGPEVLAKIGRLRYRALND
jgi:tetratricopeptide (TPR) repeat protein